MVLRKHKRLGTLALHVTNWLSIVCVCVCVSVFVNVCVSDRSSINDNRKGGLKWMQVKISSEGLHQRSKWEGLYPFSPYLTSSRVLLLTLILTIRKKIDSAQKKLFVLIVFFAKKSITAASRNNLTNFQTLWQFFNWTYHVHVRKKLISDNKQKIFKKIQFLEKN